MENSIDPQNGPAQNPFRLVGTWAMICGALGLLMVFAQIVGPTFEPSPSVGTQIGEIAGDIRRSAWRTFLGLGNPEPEPTPLSIWIYVGFAGVFLGLVAIVLSVISGVMREDRRLTSYGAGLGVAAVTFQFFWWVALLIAGIVLLVAIIANIGDIFSL